MGKHTQGKTFLTTNKKKPVHPRSRKAVQIVRQIKKGVKAEQAQKQANQKLQLLGIKLAFFKENLDTSLQVCTRAHIDELIEKYIARNNEELETLNAKKLLHGNVRQHAAREDALTYTLAAERKQYYETGFEMVDVFDAPTFKRFKTWEGDLKTLPAFKLRTYVKSKLMNKG
ncbi:Translation machinery-associated protein 16 [Trinorchestia longiramus]|nr:Translation machinery-associated protein 16 [Trinorchestia longiramus]